MGLSSSKGSTQSNQQAQSTSASLNQAYPQLQSQLTPVVDNGVTANNSVLNLLGLNGQPAQMAGFDNFRNSGGYNFIKDEGLNGVTGTAAASGLLNSGSYGKALTNYNSNLASTWLDKYLTHVSTAGSQGLTAAQTLSGAGNTANSQSTSIGSSSGKNSSFSLSSG